MGAPVPEVFEHAGLWAEEEFLALRWIGASSCVDPGQPLVLTESIAVTFDLAALAATTRPPS